MLTVVDSEIVRLVKAMHAQYAEHRHGTYSLLPPKKTDALASLKNFDLYFTKALPKAFMESDEELTYSLSR